MAEQPKESGTSWWHTTQGVLMAIATLITAIGGLIATIHSCSVDDSKRAVADAQERAQKAERDAAVARQAAEEADRLSLKRERDAAVALARAEEKEKVARQATEEADRLKRERDAAVALARAEEKEKVARQATEEADRLKRERDAAETAQQAAEEKVKKVAETPKLTFRPWSTSSLLECILHPNTVTVEWTEKDRSNPLESDPFKVRFEKVNRSLTLTYCNSSVAALEDWDGKWSGKNIARSDLHAYIQLQSEDSGTFKGHRVTTETRDDYVFDILTTSDDGETVPRGKLWVSAIQITSPKSPSEVLREANFTYCGFGFIGKQAQC